MSCQSGRKLPELQWFINCIIIYCSEKTTTAAMFFCPSLAWTWLLVVFPAETLHCYQLAQPSLQHCDWLINKTTDRLSMFMTSMLLLKMFTPRSNWTGHMTCMFLLNVPISMYRQVAIYPSRTVRRTTQWKQEFRPQTNKTLLLFLGPLGFAEGIRLDESELRHIKHIAVLKSTNHLLSLFSSAYFFFFFFTIE